LDEYKQNLGRICPDYRRLADEPGHEVAGIVAAVAGALPPTFGNPMRPGVAVIIKMTPDRLATVRRAALRAVRKFACV
jgi:hypothetical protein